MPYAKPMNLPELTAEEWLEAFRDIERTFAPNKSRIWVLQCMRDRMEQIVEERPTKQLPDII